MGIGAQTEIKFGARGGVNLFTQDYRPESAARKADSKLGFDLALVSNIPLGKMVSIAPELHWLQKGYVIEEIGFVTSGVTSTLNYLEIPVLVKFNFGETAKFFVMGGPGFGYLLGGNEKYEGDGTHKINFDGLNRIELSAQFGAGISIGKVVIDVRYMSGLSNLAKDQAEGIAIYNTGFGGGISFMF